MIYISSEVKIQGESQSGVEISILRQAKPNIVISMSYISSGVKIQGESKSET